MHSGIKSGIVPYYFDAEGKLLFNLMVPSDPNFGGTSLQIAKGCYDFHNEPADLGTYIKNIDKRITIKETAIKEGQEELGLKCTNFDGEVQLEWSGSFYRNKPEEYIFYVYAVKIKDPVDFDKPHYETGRTAWTVFDSPDIREEHQDILKIVAERVISKNK